MVNANWGSLFHIRSVIILSKLIVRQEIKNVFLFRPDVREKTTGTVFFNLSQGGQKPKSSIDFKKLKDFPVQIDKASFSYFVEELDGDYFGFCLKKKDAKSAIKDLILICLDEIKEYLQNLFMKQEIFKDSQELYDSKIITSDSRMKKLVRDLPSLAGTEGPIHLQGEVGVGKDLIAHFIHYLSSVSGNFVELNCAELNEDEISIELFGVRSATSSQMKGSSIVKVKGGTLYLKEVQCIPPRLQWKLATLITKSQSSEDGFEPFFLVTSSQQTLSHLSQKGVFVPDLYYLLSKIELNVPPLRERKDDVLAFSLSILDRELEKVDKRHVTFAPESMEVLKFYTWPGNLKEIAREMARLAAFMKEHSQVQPKDLSEYILKSCLGEIKDLASSQKKSMSFNEEDLQKAIILKALSLFDWNLGHSSRYLKIDEKALTNQINRYSLDKRKKKKK